MRPDRAKIQFQLFVSHFLLALLVSFARLWSSQPGPPLPAPSDELPPPEAIRLARAWERAGVEGLRQELNTSNPLAPPDAWITFHDSNQVAHCMRGPEVFGPPDLVQAVLRGKTIYHRATPEGCSHLVPLRDRKQQIVGALALEWGWWQHQLRPQLRLRHQLGLVGAVLAILVFSSLVAAWVARGLTLPLARLNQQLQADEPLDPCGPPEIRQLCLSFNETRRKLTQVQEQQSRFLADVSHQLRTPLTAICAWLEEARLGRGLGSLERAQRELELMGLQIERLLELSRWKHTTVLLRPEHFALLEVVMEVVELLEEQALAQGIRLTVEGHVHIYADRMRIRELMQVFFENAVQHAGPGCQIDFVACTEGERVRVEIRDNGRGLGENSGRRPGLGLSIARHILQAHGSPLHWESHAGKGTFLSFHLSQSRTVDLGAKKE